MSERTPQPRPTASKNRPGQAEGSQPGRVPAGVTATKYRTIVADPPWPQPDSGARTQSTAGNWRGKWLGYISEIPYATMTLDDIRALPVGDLAEDNAHLYLWTTNRFLEESFSVARAWGSRAGAGVTVGTEQREAK